MSSIDLQLWSHYDVADNFLIHLSGYKLVTMFHPLYSQLLGISTTADSSSVPYTQLDLELLYEKYQQDVATTSGGIKQQGNDGNSNNNVFTNYIEKYPGLFLSYPYRHQVILCPGDILFIPSLWLHHVTTLDTNIAQVMLKQKTTNLYQITKQMQNQQQQRTKPQNK
eukprot:UN04127